MQPALALAAHTRAGTRLKATLRGRIDGDDWSAADPVLVTVLGGILGLAGFDTSGRGVAIALVLDRVGEDRPAWAGPANAMVTIGGQTWKASEAPGAGSVSLVSVTGGLAAGEFAFLADPLPSILGLPPKSVTEGFFEIRL